MRAASAQAFLLVALGGGAGSCLRHLVGVLLPAGEWPRATFLVNVSGCLAFGLVTGLAAARPSEPLRLLLVTGLLGGYTTFSAFGGETTALLRERPLAAAAYALASVGAGVVAVAAGARLGAAAG